MRRKFFNVLILTVMVILTSWSACFADILSVLPERLWGAASGDNYSVVSVRLADAGKLIGDLYPRALFEAVLPYSADLDCEKFVSFGNIIKSLSESNIGELAVMFAFDELKGSGLIEAGLIMSVRGGGEIWDEASKSGKITLFSILSSLGDDVLEAFRDFDDFKDFEFTRGSDGVFEYRNTYFCFEGDCIMFFETKEGALAAAEAVRAGGNEKTAPGSPNVIRALIRKDTAGTSEDIKLETSLSYEDAAWKIRTVTNAFKVLPNALAATVKFENEDSVKIAESMPLVGNGDPFFTGGGYTGINGIDEIEEQLMNTGDMEFTLLWASFLQMAKGYGISKADVGNLLAESGVMIFGLNSAFMEIPLPIGGYLAFTGKDGAAEKIIGAASEALAQMGIAVESKVESWDKVYAVSLDPSFPGAVIAQRGETLLVGIMNPEDLGIELSADTTGVSDDKKLSWVTLSPEKLWKALRNAYPMLSEMLLSGILGNVNYSQKEVIQFAEKLLDTDIPLNAVKLWLPSDGEMNMDIEMNPSPSDDFWKTFFELVFIFDN